MPTEEMESEIIRAAGGLVWRNSPERHGRQLAVIFRTRRGDWTLPKGKLEPGEQWQDTALREVLEETGCAVALRDLAGCVSYLDNGKPKVVLFWNMVVKGECKFTPSEEVGELLWLTPEEALKKLDYPAEKALLIGALNVPVRRSSLEVPIHTSSKYVRLAASIATYRVELSFLRGHSVPRPFWRQAADELLDLAEQALKEHNEELGWRYFKAARRMELFGMSDPALKARANTLLAEAREKLSAWRKKSVEDLLLDKQGELRTDLNAVAMFSATQVLDEHHDNVYHKLREFRNQPAIVALTALTVSCIWIVLALLMPNAWNSISHPLFLVSVSLYGIIGAAFSGFLSLAGDHTRKRIPEQLANFRIIIARLAIGAVSALVVYVFLVSEIIRIGDLTHGLVLAASFIAGFSERLVVRAVETVDGARSDKKTGLNSK